MNRLYFKIIAFTYFLLSVNNIIANDSIIIKNNHEVLDVSPFLLIYEDKSNSLSFEDVLPLKFISTNKKVSNLGISNSTFWIKIPITNLTVNEVFLLDVSVPTIDFIEFYYLDKDNLYKKIEMGEHLKFNLRKYKDPDYVFDISIKPGLSKVFYLKIKSSEGIQLPIKLGTEVLILDQLKNKGILSGLYFGIMLVMIFYNLFIYFSVRDKSYLYYVVYIVFTFFTQFSLQGYPFQYFWPDYPIFAQYSLFIFPILVGIAGIMFMKMFLDVKKHSTLLNNISYVLYIPYLISIGFLCIQNFKISQMIMEINAMIVSLYMLITPIIILKKGYQPAKYFLIAWSVFLLGICIYILKDLEILPFNNFTRYTMQIGSAIETILLSFALAARINIYKKEKEDLQTQALLALKENEILITNQNIILEQKVEKRTQELNKTLSNLKNAQAQLVDAEKMASLGQLTAGIAHEINNPINFVSANVKPLKLDIEDVLELVKKYEKIIPNESSEILFKEISEFRDQIDVEYLKQEMTDLLSGIEDGAKRTADIVLGMRNFSRLDENDIKLANINEGIESTLILLKSSVPNNTEIITTLNEIPLIECLPGKLNQVFMNLFSNALYAIKLKNNDANNKLIISTSYKEENVYISIEDTGIGMTPEVKTKMFEPFFTTKEVGEGTGLGMSIVFKIIESHGAKIEVETEYGVGTKILLILNKKINLIQAL